MDTSIQRRDVQAAAGQSTGRVLSISAIFVAVLSTAWLIGRQFVAPEIPLAERYRGTVRLAPDRDGRCAQFELDNKTGLMWPKGATLCGGDVTTSVQPPQSGQSSGPMGRLNSISEHFRSR